MAINLKKNLVDLKDKAQEVTGKAVDKAQEVKDKAIKLVDQNDDGSFDINDISVVKNAVMDNMKDASNRTSQFINDKMMEAEYNQLKPIFAEDLYAADFITPIIRISEKDNKHKQSEVCKDSVGFYDEYDGLRIINIYPEYLNLVNYSFYPDINSDVYYVDPTEHDNYIALNKYSTFLLEARINELSEIAQSLGAKHFKVTIRERKASQARSHKEGLAKLKKHAEAGAEVSTSSQESREVKIAKESFYPGSEPETPKLRYLSNDITVKNLIKERINSTNRTGRQSVIIEMSDSSGIRHKDAVKIEALLKRMNVALKGSLVEEIQQEELRFFEYEIEF